VSCPFIDLQSWPPFRADRSPKFAPGDTVRVQVKIRAGEKERLQAFEGMVIAAVRAAQGSFTVSQDEASARGVERIFPYNSKS